jgi:nicotinate-nucleotide pyrophosphorylase (carboxylating)
MLDKNIQGLIDAALLEDLGERGDVTSSAIKKDDLRIIAQIISKADGVMCGGEIVKHVFKTVDQKIQINILAKDGAPINKQDVLIKLAGPSQNILTAERTALNFLGRLCGIATTTNKFKKALLGLKTQIFDTRKTMPGWRTLEKYAVKCGGGRNHRIGLFDMFLIKENHIAAAGGITAAVLACREYMSRNSFNAEIEVETQNTNDVNEALTLAVDRIMLDNMTIKEMKNCVSIVNGKIPLEASGNVTLQNVYEIAQTGVDYISVGAITHSAQNFDTSLLVLSTSCQ